MSARVEIESDEIDIVALWRIVWTNKYIVVLIAGLATLISVFLALTATPIYQAEVVVTEVENPAMGGPSSLVGQLGGLASLAGVSLSTGGGPSQQARAILQSRRLVEEFVSRNEIVTALSAADGEPLTLWLAVKKFRDEVLTIAENDRTGRITVSTQWKDPIVATAWANAFVDLANDLVRTNALDEASKNIKYLNAQVTETNVVELQRVIYNLIQNEMRNLMLANARVQYAFSVVDPAVVPERRIRPQRTLMVMIGGSVGLLLGLVAAFCYNAYSTSRQPVSR